MLMAPPRCVETCDRATKAKQYTSKDRVRIRWTCAFEEICETDEHDVWICHLLCRGVPLPDGWRTAIRALDLCVVAEKATHEAAYPRNIQNPACAFLGAARSAELPREEEQLLCVGAVVGKEAQYIACAHVQDHHWLVYPADALETDALDPALLIMKDIVANDVIYAAPPPKRVRLRSKTSAATLALPPVSNSAAP